MDDLYHELLLAEAREPKNRGTLVSPDAQTTQVNASCGDTVHVMINLSRAATPDQHKIAEIRWEGTGCIISQASLSIVSSLVQGMTLTELRQLTAENILEHLGLQTISPGRLKCLLLGLTAVQKLAAENTV